MLTKECVVQLMGMLGLCVWCARFYERGLSTMPDNAGFYWVPATPTYLIISRFKSIGLCKSEWTIRIKVYKPSDWKEKHCKLYELYMMEYQSLTQFQRQDHKMKHKGCHATAAKSPWLTVYPIQMVTTRINQTAPKKRCAQQELRPVYRETR